MADTGWLDELNPAQRRAATHGEGPLLIVAGAGTGKTRTLASRVAWLVSQGTPPERILLLTFTRRAAAEMITRAARVAGAEASRVWGGTFHAVANRLLHRWGRFAGLSPGFTVMDQADAADVMNMIRTELAPDRTDRRFPRKGTLAEIYSRMVNSRTKLGAVLREHFPWFRDSQGGIREIFARYAARKREQNVLDYDDLLLYWQAVLDSPEAGAKVAGLFDHVLVDEYQDTNLVQAGILRALRRKSPNITVVGDDAQSIYSFRAATVKNILEFPEQFPGTAVVKLEENYRSTAPILDLANAVMAESRQRHEKKLFTERAGGEKPELVACQDEAEQCAEVCRRVLELRERGTALREQAVLFRAGWHSDALEVELSRRNVPFVKYGGLKFLEAAHIKDLVAALRLLENPRDVTSWFRVLLLLPGVGPANARRLLEAVGALGPEAGTPPGPLRRLLDSPPPVPAAARPDFSELRAALGDCSRPRVPPAAQVERLRKFYAPVFERVYPDHSVRLRDLEQLELVAGRYRSRASFVTDLTLDPPASTADLAGPPHLDEDYLILSTIHSAKGCEWDAVHVIHAADGMIPSDMATGSDEEIEEERRLLYVALTRPRDALCIYFPLRYYHRGKGQSDAHTYAQLSRFLAKLPRELCTRVAAGGVLEEDAEAEPGGDGSVTPPAKSVEDFLGSLLGE